MPIIIQNKWPFLSVRNRAIADQYLAKMGLPVWSDLSIQKAVKEGYKKSGWVYKSVRLIGSSFSSVPWVVYTPEGVPIDKHPVTMLMKNPNPRISRQKLMELLCAWIQLTGNSYVLPIKGGRNTEELWPVSPDRLLPIATNDPVEWVKGYALDGKTEVTYKPEEVIHFLFPDPAKPIIGIGPLQAASKAVDVDVEQQDWQKASLQNRGVLDGIFTFKREFKNLDALETLTDKLNEKFTGKNGKRIGAIGSEASYNRIAATPQEMDSLEARRFTREEIFIIFGVPPQLAGAQESSTYNNYQTSELIFWINTIVPLLDDFKDTLNFALKEELGENSLGYDLSKVPAIRRAQLDRVKSGQILTEMGVPVEQVNKILDLNIEQYEGWDKSNPKINVASEREPSGDSKESDSRSLTLKTLEQRDSGEEEALAREDEAIEKAGLYEAIFEEQQTAVFNALNTGSDMQSAINSVSPELRKVLGNHYMKTGMLWAEEIALDIRAFEDDVAAEIGSFLEAETVILTELSHIQAGTANMITQFTSEALISGASIAEVQQSIIDIGTFSPERALRISRTVTGAAASIGQLASGSLSGATTKTWQTSMFEVRDAHKNRSFETVGIDERFSIQLDSIVGPRFPGDPEISAGDRINCRCSLTFA